MVKDAKGNEVEGLDQGPFEPIAVIGVSASVSYTHLTLPTILLV